MLEIIILIFLCRTNKKNAIAAGKSGNGAIGLTIGLWFGFEFLGAFIGGAAKLGSASYILALVFAIIGAITSYVIAKKPPKKTASTYNPTQTPIPPQQTAASLTPSSMQMPPVPPSDVHKKKDVFYVFAVQGPAFGMAGGSDIILEKAQTLKNGYEPAKDMDLKIIRPNQWNSNIQSSNSGGVISVSYNLEAFKDRIRTYLLKEGIPDGTIERGIKLCEENSLLLSNPMSGVFVMGTPLVLESKPDAEAEAQPSLMPESAPQPVPVSCAHEYKHFTCIKCGEKAPKPRLASKGIRKQNNYTYEDYTALTAEAARFFLEQTTVNQPLYYVMVQTPEGEWGRDKDGMFLSQLCDFQRNLSLRQCDAKTALVPKSMLDVQMAANKVTDNYLLSVTCGQCGYSWIDGVGYRTKTIVRCPECEKYNLADTAHIRFNDL